MRTCLFAAACLLAALSFQVYLKQLTILYANELLSSVKNKFCKIFKGESQFSKESKKKTGKTVEQAKTVPVLTLPHTLRMVDTPMMLFSFFF